MDNKKEFLKQFTVVKLRAICSSLDLDSTGKKNDIIQRLSEVPNFDKVKKCAIDPVSVKSKKVTKKYTKEKIPVTVRNIVWNTYVGSELKQSFCLCCSTEPITCANFDCGHVIAEKNGGSLTIDNLRPICGHCNKSIGTQNMEDFINKHNIVKNKNWNGINGVTNNAKVITNKQPIASDSSDSSSSWDTTTSSDSSDDNHKLPINNSIKEPIPYPDMNNPSDISQYLRKSFKADEEQAQFAKLVYERSDNFKKWQNEKLAELMSPSRYGAK